MSVTLVRPTQVVEIFGNISTAFDTKTENFTEIVPGEPLRRGRQTQEVGEYRTYRRLYLGNGARQEVS